MVWPPQKIQATPEGEAQREGKVEPRQPEVTGAYGASSGALPSALPIDWLQHPEKLVGAVLGGRYRITGLLGRGPMGFAVEAQSARGRQVTLKLLPRPPELSVERFAWLVREALALAHFDHVNVVASTDFGPLEDGGAFVSRARVPGVPLRALSRQGLLPLRRALDLARQIALALEAGHAQEISHGRLKPENILVQAGAQVPDLVKVVDFGIGQLPSDLRAMVGGDSEARRLALRTRVYLPNAHRPGVEGLPPSPAVDVYSLAVVLFEMIAGQPPFAIDNGGFPHLQGGIISFAQCNPPRQVPSAIAEIVSLLLRPEAGVSAREVAGALDSLLARPSVAPPAPVEQEPVTSQRASLPLAAGASAGSGPIAGSGPVVSGAVPSGAVASGPVPSGPIASGGQVYGLSAGGPPVPIPSLERPPGTTPPSRAERPTPPPLRRPSYPPLPAGFAASQAPPGPLREPAPYPALLPPAPSPSISYPPPTPGQGLPSPIQSPVDSISAPRASEAVSYPASSELDDAELEFRPSLLARLRRMFGRSRRGGEF